MEKAVLLYDEWKEKVFSCTAASFEKLALELFNLQYERNTLYRQFVDSLKIVPAAVKDIRHIPFLPITFFKTQQVITENPLPKDAAQQVFLSSGTTGQVQSKHDVRDVSVYETSFRKAFELFYGDVKDYAIFALLPSYQEREGSSLIYMVNDLIGRSGIAGSGFYAGRYGELAASLVANESSGRKNLLLGVSYALLDFIEKEKLSLENTIVMETGGMKGRRKELVREELHELLCEGFGVKEIHSEYGMTELLSQAYSKGEGIFHAPPWMRVLARDPEDPFRILEDGRTGGINIIDLANINSCCFIATQDLGRTHPDASFEVLGRFDNSDIRGCNLLVQ